MIADASAPVTVSSRADNLPGKLVNLTASVYLLPVMRVDTGLAQELLFTAVWSRVDAI